MMGTPQRAGAQAPLQVIDGGRVARWPRRPLGTIAFRGARWLLLAAAVGYGPSHPLGHVSREMVAAMRLV